jgi:hypothetical protein
MSTHELKPGDRVRVRTDCPDRGYRLGDKGTVWSGLHRRGGGGWHYYVWMDTAKLGDTPVGFHADEIEPDL